MVLSVNGLPLADIPQLCGGIDWQSWKTSVELRVRTLNDERLLTENPPLAATPDQRNVWKRKDAFVASLLYSHCSPKVKQQLTNHTTSAIDIWTRLHYLFDETGFQAKNIIINGLRHIKPSDYETIEDYLNAFEHQVNLCRTMAGWTIEEDIACFFLLDDLSDSLEYWCTVKRSSWRHFPQSASLASLIREAKDEARRQKVLKTDVPAILPPITSSPEESATGDSLQSLQQYLRYSTTNDDYAPDPMYANKEEFKKDIEDAVTSAVQAAQEQKPQTATPIENHASSPFPDIREFDGERSSYEAWKYQLNIKLSFDKRLGSEEEKAAYVMTRLRGQALGIFTYRDPEAIPKSATHVLMVLDKFFGARDKVNAARSQIESMRQGNRPLDEFVTELNHDQHFFLKKKLLSLNLPDLIDNLMELVEYEAARDCFVENQNGGINKASTGVGGRNAA